jgi:hypothetical protein
MDGCADFVRRFIWIRVSDSDQKQLRFNFCEELRQITSDNTAFLSRFIAGN